MGGRYDFADSVLYVVVYFSWQQQCARSHWGGDEFVHQTFLSVESVG